MADIEDLPDDPELAFLELVGHYKDALTLCSDNNGRNSYPDCMAYLVSVTSAAKALDLDILEDWRVFAYDSDDFDHEFLRFASEVDHYLNVIRIRHARRTGTDGVRLNDQEKQILHGYIEKMRQIIASSQIPDERKEKIYAVLSELALEVSRDRTRFDRIATFTRKLAGLSADTANEGALPWAKIVLAFLGKLDAAKLDEQQRLPPPAPRKALPPPNKPKAAGDSGDDAIPF